MACELKLQISNYNADTNKVEVSEIAIGTIAEDGQVNYDYVASIISQLDKDTRSALAAQLRVAKVQKINNTTWDNHQLISNTSLNELIEQYPDLEKYNIPKDLQYNFTLLKCYKAEFNGTAYKGRAVNSKGEEIFIINNIFDAEKLFKHLQVKLNLVKFIQGNNVDESLKEYQEDLDMLTKHYRRDNIQRLIEDFLIDKHAYLPFKVGGKLYNPRRIINRVLSQITGELYDEGDKSELYVALEAVKTKSSNNDAWVFDKKKLYDVLEIFSEDIKSIPFDQFKQLDTQALNDLLYNIFKNDVHLIKAKVIQASQGKQIITEPKVKEVGASITIELNKFDPIGKIYDFSYDTQNIYSFVEQYKGFYIYEFYKDGATHYAISRSIISPNAYMSTYSNLDRAKAAVDKNKDTLEQCGLWSIKQFTGTPRVSKIEMKSVKAGSIITTLDIELPKYNKNNFSDSVKQLLKGTVANFQDKLRFIENIDSLDTPEKATAFIYLAQQTLKTGQDFIEALQENAEKVQSIITKINNSKPISYFIEKVDGFGKAYLKLLKNNGTTVDVDGKIPDLSMQDFVDYNLNELIDYFNQSFGIKVTGLTKSELEIFNAENKLGMEHKLDTINAFVHNGQIYIVTSNASVENLFHELSHIFLGVLKASDPEAYQEVIKSYTTQSTYKYLHQNHKQTYKHYSEEDVAEETVADMIAEKLFQAKQLGTNDLQGDQVLGLFEEIFKRSNRFTKSLQDNGLGFQKYMRNLLDENAGTMERNMRISNLVQQLISDGKIKEYC